jgi:RHS repeat-associated protein
VVNGDRKSLNAGSDGAWVDAGPAYTFPDWVQVDFGANKTLDEIDVFTLQDNYAGSSEPTETMTFTQWGLTGYEVQYWDGGNNWVTVAGGSVTGNNKIWRKFTFAPITTSKIRVLTNASVDGYSRLTEIEAYAPAEAGGAGGIHWLIADHLGTPRMVIDQTGDLANMKRHDYLPFGEELFAPISGRSAAQGYAGGDGVRQQFTSKERDVETGLDYFNARYYSSVQGRFISPDPIFSSSRTASPQSWNRYSFCINTPLVLRDLTGLDWGVTEWTDERGTHRNYHWFSGKVGTYRGRVYTPVNFGSQGFLDVRTDGGVVRIRNTGIIRQVIYSGPSGVGTGGWSPSTLNMSAGFLDGAIPFGKEVREAVFGKMGVDTSSPEYENAALISTGVSIGAQLLTGSGEAQLGLKLASRAGGTSAEATLVRVIQRGEKVEEIINEAKALTFQTGNEHALVKLASGERVLVSGGPGGIHFAEGSVTRIFGHTHLPTDVKVGPSKADKIAIQALGQRSSWLSEGFKPTKFTP